MAEVIALKSIQISIELSKTIDFEILKQFIEKLLKKQKCHVNKNSQQKYLEK